MWLTFDGGVPRRAGDAGKQLGGELPSGLDDAVGVRPIGDDATVAVFDQQTQPALHIHGFLHLIAPGMVY